MVGRASRRTGDQRNWRDHYYRDISPHFGRTPVGEISTPAIQKWVASLEGKRDLKRSTIEAKLKLLQALLAAKRGKSAQRDGLISTNPCWGVNIGRVDPAGDPDQREANRYTWPEVRAILAVLDPYWQMMVRVQVDLGCRWNELQGLQVRDLLDDDHVCIHRVIDEGRREDSPNGTPFAVKEYPKNKTRRMVQMTAAVAALVREHIADRGLSGEDFLFSARVGRYNNKPLRTAEWPNGRPVYRSCWNQNWQRAMRRAGVPRQVPNRHGDPVDRRPYDLRATNASTLLDRGVPRDQVRERLGQRDDRSLNRYVARPDSQSASIEALDGWYEDPGQASSA